MLPPIETTTELLWHAMERTVEAWGRGLEVSGREPEGHGWRVAEMSLILAKKMTLSNEDQANVVLGAFLHDIGKLAIPESILLKPGKLDDSERALIEQHPIFARQMLGHIEMLRPAMAVPYSHHERWDGRGYPHGLKGDQIPLIARVFAVVDVWDALSVDQPYRNAWEQTEVIAHIQEGAGTHFDPDVVEHFLVLVSDPELVQRVIVEAAERPAKLLAGVA